MEGGERRRVGGRCWRRICNITLNPQAFSHNLIPQMKGTIAFLALNYSCVLLEGSTNLYFKTIYHHSNNRVLSIFEGKGSVRTPLKSMAVLHNCSQHCETH